MASPLPRLVAAGRASLSEGDLLNIPPPAGKLSTVASEVLEADRDDRFQHSVVYLDSTAIGKLAVTEPESDALRQYFAGHADRVSSVSPCWPWTSRSCTTRLNSHQDRCAASMPCVPAGTYVPVMP